MRVNREKTFFLVAALFFLAEVSCFAAKAGENLKVTMGIHFASTMGKSSAQLFDMAKGSMNVLNEKYGIEVIMKNYSTYEEIEEAFLRDELDAALLGPVSIVSMIERGGEVTPLVTYRVNKAQKSAYCLWSRKGMKLANISDVSGKSLVYNMETIEWPLYLRDYLYRNGMDKPLWNVFRGFIRVPGGNSAFMSLAMGDADFFWNQSESGTILKLIAPNVASQVHYDLCSDDVFARGIVVANARKMSEDDIKKADGVLIKCLREFNKLAETDTGLKALKQYLSIAKIRFVPARPDEADYEMKLFETARKRGWIGEAEFIMEQMKKEPKGKLVEIKPDFNYCKKACPEGKGQMACIDKCME